MSEAVPSADQAKKRQKMVFTFVALFSVVVVVLGLFISDPNRSQPTLEERRKEEQQKSKSDFRVKSSTVSAEEKWVGLTEKRFADYEKSRDADKQEIENLKKALSEVQNKPSTALPATTQSQLPMQQVPSESATSPAFPTTNNARLPPAPYTVGDRALPPPETNPNNTATNLNGQPGTATSLIVDIDVSKPVAQTAAETKKSGKNINHYLPATTFSTAVLLNGADAPTGAAAKTDPAPFVIRLLDFGNLPNYFESDIKDCRANANGYGDLSSERVKIRLEKFTCILENGDIIETKVTGYINGEDGKEGFRGRVVEKMGALLGKSWLAGLASGFGTSVEMQNMQISQSPLGTVQTIDPNKALQSGLAKGISVSSEKLSDYYLQRASELHPVIELAAMRIGEIVLQDGIDFERDIIGKVNHDDQTTTH